MAMNGSLEKIRKYLTNGKLNAYTIAEGGGKDTFDFLGRVFDQTINRSARNPNATKPSISDVGGLVGNPTLAVGTFIENAVGGTGTDVLGGGFGWDLMFAGNHNDQDKFIFREVSASGLANSARDSIYQVGSGKDHIELSAIDANTNMNGDQALTFSTVGVTANAVWVTDTGPDLVSMGISTATQHRISQSKWWVLPPAGQRLYLVRRIATQAGRIT